MANITVFEFSTAPNSAGEVTWPADTATTGTTATVFTLGQFTRAVIVCADTDARMFIDGPTGSTVASASTIPVLSAVQNQFVVSANASQTLRFA